MITDPQVFADDHLPRTLQHREGEVDALSRAFAPALDGEPPNDVLLHGPHGVGKTVLARHTFDRLEQRCDASYAHVETMGLTTAGVVRTTLQKLGAEPAKNTAREDLCLQLREFVDEPTVVVLDEGDDLAETDALERLLDVPQLAVVPIVHDPDDWLARVDDRVRDRLHGHDLGLDRYGVSELADILAARARHGLEVTPSREYLEAIADYVAGVARFGIQTLRAAAEIADERGHRSIRGVDVESCYERAQHAIRVSNLGSLPFHHQVLYALIWRAGDLPAATLHNQYDAVADEVYRGVEQMPVGKRSRRNKLSKLEEYGLITRHGEGQGPLSVVDDVEPLVDLSEPLP